MRKADVVTAKSPIRLEVQGVVRSHQDYVLCRFVALNRAKVNVAPCGRVRHFNRRYRDPNDAWRNVKIHLLHATIESVTPPQQILTLRRGHDRTEALEFCIEGGAIRPICVD